jgi:hypothetical protein
LGVVGSACRHCERKRSNPWRGKIERWIASSHALLAMGKSSPRHRRHPRACGDPVRRGLSISSPASLEYWMVRSCAQLRTRRTMTVEGVVSSRAITDMLLRSAAWCARDSVKYFRHSDNRGRGECRVPNAPAALCAHIGSEYAHRYSQRRHRKHPAFPTQWFYGFLRALPGDHRFVDPVIRATRWHPRELDACFGAPEPHGFAVRNRKRSSHAPSRPPHPAPRSATIGRNAPCTGTG